VSSDLPWAPAPARVVLTPDDVHVWRVRLDPPDDQVAALAALLSADERRRAARLRAAARQRRFVVAHGLVRTILARYLGAAPADLRFDHGVNGKPALAGAPLRFNLSHSYELALVGVTQGRELGIDIERVRDTVAIAPLAARFFSAAERALLQALPDGERRAGFFRLWTRKEAYLKATGEGVSRELRAIDVTAAPEAGAAAVRVHGVVDARFTVHALGPDPAYVAALVVEGSDARVSGWRWSA